MESNRNIFSYLWVLFAFWGVCQLAGAQSSNQNYIRTRTYTGASTYLDRIQYYDGLGRLFQTVDKGITPGRHDLVTAQEYDSLGRPSFSWLPGMVENNNGAIVTDGLVEAVKASNRGDQKPFSMPVYEPSPLNRVTHQFGPGEEWYNNGRAVKTEYLTNSTNDSLTTCVKFYYSDPHFGKSGNYPQGSLYVTKVTDEDNNVSYEFKDKLGRVLLQRQIGDDNLRHDTYYIYDDYGNLCFVLPPLAAEYYSGQGNMVFNNGDEKVTSYCYRYKYDHRNRRISSRFPNTAGTEMVYDRADRLVLLQDGKEKGNTWKFYRYDAHGRLVISGVKSDATSADTYRTSFKESLFVESRVDGGVFLYTSSCPYSATPGEIMSVNYYDDPSWLDLLPSADRNMLTYTAKPGYGTAHPSAKGLLTGTWGKLLDGSVEYCEAYYYDDKGQLVQRISKNHTGGFDKQYIGYNYDGTVERKLTEHTGPNATAVTELYTYAYDHASRLTKTIYQLNNESPVVMAEYTYNDQGRVFERKLSGGSSWNDYTYTVRGWTDLMRGNKLSQWLRYTNGGSGYFGGNISFMDYWMTGEDGKGYSYTYDKLGRLREAYSRDDNSQANNRFSENMTYDKHGNILTLKRYGLKNNGTYGLVDDLRYNSYMGNMVTSIVDDAGNQYRNDQMEQPYASWFSKYGYDDNGSLICDGNKSICSIEYNYLHLPKRIQHQAGHVAEYVYDASGVKRRTRHLTVNRNMGLGWVDRRELSPTDIQSTIQTDYIDNKVYENGVLKMILTEEGYVAKEGSLFKHYYYIKDYLGNNRLVVDANGTVVQKNYYYPFGLPQPNSTAQEKQPYKYNGKEMDKMLSMNWYDYSARFFDGAMGRFYTQDPLAEKYYSISPYVYVNNNPVRFIDPNGEDWVDRVVGAGVGLVTNAVPFSTGLRDIYSPTDAGDYNSTLRGVDNTAMAVGAIVAIEGGMNMAAGEMAKSTGVAIAVGSGGLGSEVGVVATQGGQTVSSIGAVKLFAGAVMFLNAANNSSKGYDYGEKKSNSSSGTTNTEKTRASKGGDGATSKHIVEKDANGNTLSKTHQVTSKDGKVIHQHQDYVPQNIPPGEKAKMRQFPDEWSKYPKIDTP